MISFLPSGRRVSASGKVRWQSGRLGRVATGMAARGGIANVRFRAVDMSKRTPPMACAARKHNPVKQIFRTFIISSLCGFLVAAAVLLFFIHRFPSTFHQGSSIHAAQAYLLSILADQTISN